MNLIIYWYLPFLNLIKYHTAIKEVIYENQMKNLREERKPSFIISDRLKQKHRYHCKYSDTECMNDYQVFISFIFTHDKK